MRAFKFNETLKVTFEKQLGDITTYKTAYFNSKAKTITNVNESHQELKASQEEMLYLITTWLSEGSGWVVGKINNHYVNIVKYQPLKRSSCIRSSSEGSRRIIRSRF